MAEFPHLWICFRNGQATVHEEGTTRLNLIEYIPASELSRLTDRHIEQLDTACRERDEARARIAELERDLPARHWIDEWLWGNSERRLAVEIDHRLRAYREDGSWVEAEDYPRLSLALGWKDDGHA